MSTTQVTIEDLTSITLSPPAKSVTRPAVKSVATQPKTTQKDDSLKDDSLSDMGEVTLSSPTKKSVNDQKKSSKTAAKAASTKTTAAVDADDFKLYDPVTGKEITPLTTAPVTSGTPQITQLKKLDKKPSAPAKKTASKQAGLDLEHAQEVIADEQQRLDDLNSLPLDKDNFVPNLLAIAEALATPTPEYNLVVASLDEIFADVDDESLAKLEDKLRSQVKAVDTARTNLEKRVEVLFDSFPTGNNWYRLLAAWDVLAEPRFTTLVADHNWLVTLDQLALNLISEEQKQALIANRDAGVAIDESVQLLLKNLEAHDLKFTPGQKRVLAAKLTPIVSGYLATAPALNAPTPGVDQEWVEDRCSRIDGRLDDLQKLLRELTTPQADRLESVSQDLAATAQTLDKLTDDFNATTKRLSQLEQATANGIRQLGETSVNSITKVATQLENKLEKEKEANITRMQTIKEQLAKNHLDIKQKLSGFEAVISSFRKLQSGRDQDQNKKMSGIRDEMLQTTRAHTKRLEDTQASFSKTRRDVEERLHQYSSQLSVIKSDQIRIDQVQTAALAELTTQTQANKTKLTDLGDRLEKIEKTEDTFEALKARVDAQLQAMTARLTNELDANKAKLDKMSSQISDLQAYASRLETENEELRIANAGLKQENWQARRVLGANANQLSQEAIAPQVAASAAVNYTPQMVTNPAVASPAPVSTSIYPDANVNSSAATVAPTPVIPITPISNLAKLGITKSRLMPHSRLLTGRSLDFLALNDALQKALVGLNSFSRWLHEQAAAQVLPSVQATPVGGPTQLETQPAVAVTPNQVTAVPDVPPTPMNNDRANAIPVPPEIDTGVMTLNPHLPVGDTFSTPAPAKLDNETVVLPFMS